MAKSWELSPEDKARMNEHERNVAQRWAQEQQNKKNNATGSDETKGQRERSLGTSESGGQESSEGNSNSSPSQSGKSNTSGHDNSR